MSRRLTTTEFKARSQLQHGDVYDYSHVEYVNQHTKVLIKCRKCDRLWAQQPIHHMNGHGCPKCASDAPLGTEEFVRRAKLLHGDSYEYQTVTYVNNMTKVTIRCCKCNFDFEQRPAFHLNGDGCPRCSTCSSLKEEAWLNTHGIPPECRQKTIMLGSRRWFKVDGLVERVVYEFYGSFYHGDPRVFNLDSINTKNGKSMKELFLKTLKRGEILAEKGYELKFVWEYDWDRGLSLSTEYPCQ